MFKLALDAGHGNSTPGKRCLKSLDPNETREFTLNNRIYKYVVSLLKGYPIEVFPCHDTSGKVDISLNARTRTANTKKADLLISIHHNAGINGGAGGGISCHIYTKPSAGSVKIANLVYNKLIAETGLKGNRSKGVINSNFHMVRESYMPAVLIENGFMDSKVDVPIILSDDFAMKSAKAIVSAVLEYSGIQEKVNNDKQEEKPMTKPNVPSDWARESWEKAKVAGITDGSNPQEPATREQVIAFLVRAGVIK